MARFGNESIARLETCHSRLQTLFREVVTSFDCKIECGYRGEEEQNAAFRNNRSTKKFPDSKHNTQPSIAVDVIPYPVDWENISRFYFFGGYVKAKAESMGILIRWGGDWDGHTLTDDQKFLDLPHFELIL